MDDATGGGATVWPVWPVVSDGRESVFAADVGTELGTTAELPAIGPVEDPTEGAADGERRLVAGADETAGAALGLRMDANARACASSRRLDQALFVLGANGSQCDSVWLYGANR